LVGLTAVYVVAAALGIWGAWLAIKGIWITVEFRIVNRGDGGAEDEERSFESMRLRDLRRRWGELPDWRQTATLAQIVIAAGVIVGALGSIVSLWWA
jgi:hypothetical protein